MRRRLTALLVLGAALALAPAATKAATPSSGSVSPDTPNATWQGKEFITSNPSGICISLDPACDVYRLNITPASADFSVTISITPSRPSGDDFDLSVNGPGTTHDLESASSSGYESVTLVNPPAGQYTVFVLAWKVEAGATYTGTAELKLTSVREATEGTVLWNYDTAAAQASVEVPLRVVMVGFDPSEVDAAKVLGEIPNFQRPGVLIPRGTSPSGDPNMPYTVAGADGLINHSRRYYRNNTPFLVPYEYKWKPSIHFAPAGFTDGLLASMKQNSTTGDFANVRYREYLERYNATRGVYRGDGKQVPANAPVRFVNGEATEDWIAANVNTYFGWDHPGRGKGGGTNPGYTVYVINSWDSDAAKRHLQPDNEYHLFKINRTDPDTGEFDGIEWARIWGGRYRFMMIDLGAAPNPYEAETWGNRGRSVYGSALYDPPLWEYRANAPRPLTMTTFPERWESAVTPGESFDMPYLSSMVGRTVNQAASFRFLHTYLYEPWPGTGRFYLSDNVWHDRFAEVPWASDLRKLHNQDVVIRGLSTLTPYFTFAGDVSYQYLAEGGANFDADQQMLQNAKAKGDGIVGVPFTAMDTITAMDYLDANPGRFLRGGACYTTVPGINVVAEKHYAWYAAIAAGIAENRNGVPWGYLNSVNDVFKWKGADRDEMMAATHPNVSSGAFSYTAVHEASHYLGLAHPHDSIGATRNADGSPLYYDGFTWAFNSTAAPTTYSHTELVYSILDQESIARGHTAYYLKWADEALAEAGEAYYDRGIKTVDMLTAEARRLRKQATDAMLKSEREFARFNFVQATYAAQEAWRKAAAYRDLALGLQPGTSEIEKSTKLEGASSCPSAATK